MKEKDSVTIDNVFSDLGLEDADEMLIRSDLMSEVVTLIRNSGLTQKEIAKILEISAPKVSALMKGKINDFSNETLINYLALLGCNIEIRVTSKKRVSKSIKKGAISVRRSIPKQRTPAIRKQVKDRCGRKLKSAK